MANERPESDKSPKLPEPSERLIVVWVQAPHPATLTPAQLLSQCDLRTQRRSGPGGQHRNKTSSGVFLHHQPTLIVGEATERRSQADNRMIALQRLRFRLAVEVRTASLLDRPSADEEAALRDQFFGKSIRMSDRNEAKPAVLALVLNDLHAAGGQPSAVAPLWQTTTSAIVALVKSHLPAFALVNAIRSHHGRGGLK